MFPTISETLVNIAYTFKTENKLKDAWKYFTLAIAVNSESASAMEGRAIVNLDLGNSFESYLDIAKAVVKINSSRSYIRRILGI
jgi:hypothetical protein